MNIEYTTILTIKEALKTIANYYSSRKWNSDTDKSGKPVCPFCGSGTGADGTSAYSIDRLASGDLVGNCLKCHNSGDSQKTIAIIENLDNRTDYVEIIKKACDILGIPFKITETHQNSTNTEKTTNDTENLNSFKKTTLKSKTDGKTIESERIFQFLEECRLTGETYKENLSQHLKTTRGIEELDFISSRFLIGVCNAAIRENYQDICKQSGIVQDSIVLGYDKDIPYFFARSINGNDKRKLKNYTEDGEKVTEPIFNLSDIESMDSPIFLLEGQFDVLTMSSLGYFAIGLGGTPSKSKLDSLADLCLELGSKKTFILLGDNDDGGERFCDLILQSRLSEVANLIKFDWTAVLGIPPSVKTDICEITRDIVNPPTSEEGDGITAVQWIKSYDELFNKIDSFLSQSQNTISEQIESEHEDKLNYQQTAYDSHWVSDKFFSDMIEERKNAISTGYPSLDKMMNGGLMPYLYIIGAIPSMGKSTICLNIADEIARSGTDVLYFSVEMSRSQLLQKSIARSTYFWAIENKKDIETHSSSLEEWLDPTEQQRDVLDKVMRYYRENIALHKITIDCTCDGVPELNALSIKNAVETHIENTGRKPVVFVDYLQILADVEDGKRQETDKKKLDRTIKIFKSMSSHLKIPVVLISALNRSSYKGASLDSGSGSGGIEYSADELYSIAPDRCHYEVKNPEYKELDDLALSDICKGDDTGMYVYFKNLKNRMGRSQQKAKLILLGKYSAMVENKEIEIEATKIHDVMRRTKKR